MQDNIIWIRDAQKNKLVVGSQARILYADAEGRSKIAARRLSRQCLCPVVQFMDKSKPPKNSYRIL